MRDTGVGLHNHTLHHPYLPALSRARQKREICGMQKIIEKRYGKPLESVAEAWRPFRTWVSVLMRAHA